MWWTYIAQHYSSEDHYCLLFHLNLQVRLLKRNVAESSDCSREKTTTIREKTDQCELKRFFFEKQKKKRKRSKRHAWYRLLKVKDELFSCLLICLRGALDLDRKLIRDVKNNLVADFAPAEKVMFRSSCLLLPKYKSIIYSVSRKNARETQMYYELWI